MSIHLFSPYLGSLEQLHHGPVFEFRVKKATSYFILFYGIFLLFFIKKVKNVLLSSSFYFIELSNFQILTNQKPELVIIMEYHLHNN